MDALANLDASALPPDLGAMLLRVRNEISGLVALNDLLIQNPEVGALFQSHLEGLEVEDRVTFLNIIARVRSERLASLTSLLEAI